MEELLKIILYSFLAGVTVFLGGLLSKYFERYFHNGFAKEETIHTSIAFGGGIIVAAVAFVLVPKGMDELPLAPMSKLKNTWFPAVGASFGFLVGMIGQKTLG